jgi:hypothetical protein
MFTDTSQIKSFIDFVDLHIYPWIGSMADQMASFEITSKTKPILMGEFGVDLVHYPNLSNAVTLMRDWQVQSCKYNIQGWLAWTWGSTGADFTGYYSVDGNGGAINQILSPNYRADPCVAVPPSGSLPVISETRVGTTTNPWGLAVIATNLTSTVKVRLIDIDGKQWGSDKGVSLGDYNGGKYTYSQLPSNSPPSGCNVGKTCTISVYIVTSTGALSNKFGLVLPPK